MEEGEVDGESRGGDDVVQNRSTSVQQLATDNSEVNISPKAEDVSAGSLDSSCAATVSVEGREFLPGFTSRILEKLPMLH